MRNRREASANQVGLAHPEVHSNAFLAYKSCCTFGLRVFSHTDPNTYQACLSVQGWAIVFRTITLCIKLPRVKLPRAKAANTGYAGFKGPLTIF